MVTSIEKSESDFLNNTRQHNNYGCAYMPAYFILSIYFNYHTHTHTHTHTHIYIYSYWHFCCCYYSIFPTQSDLAVKSIKSLKTRKLFDTTGYTVVVTYLGVLLFLCVWFFLGFFGVVVYGLVFMLLFFLLLFFFFFFFFLFFFFGWGGRLGLLGGWCLSVLVCFRFL